MAKRGRKALTAAQRGEAARGPSWDPPPHLDSEALAAWRHVVGLLADAGNLERTDPVLVEAYALNVALMRAAQASLATHGLTTESAAGSLKANPAAAALNAATMRVKAIVSDLGLCPATSKYAASKPAGDDGAGKWAGVLGVVS